VGLDELGIKGPFFHPAEDVEREKRKRTETRGDQTRLFALSFCEPNTGAVSTEPKTR